MSIIYEALKKVQTRMNAPTAAAEETQPVAVEIQPELSPVNAVSEAQIAGENGGYVEEDRSLFRFVMPFAIVIMTGIIWFTGSLIYYSNPVQKWLNNAQPAPVAASVQAPVQNSVPAPVAQPRPVAQPQPIEQPQPITQPVAQPQPIEQPQPIAQPAAAQPVSEPAVATAPEPAAAVSQPAAPVPVQQPAPAAVATPTPTIEGAMSFHVQGIMTQNGQSVVLVNDRIYETGDMVGNVKILSITPEAIKVLKDGNEQTILMRH